MGRASRPASIVAIGAPPSSLLPPAAASAVVLRARRRLGPASGTPVRTRACRARVAGDGSGRRRAPRRSRRLPCFARGHDLARGVAGAADGCSVCLLSLIATDRYHRMAPKRRSDDQLAAAARGLAKRHRRVGTTSATAAADGGDEESGAAEEHALGEQPARRSLPSSSLSSAIPSHTAEGSTWLPSHPGAAGPFAGSASGAVDTAAAREAACILSHLAEAPTPPSATGSRRKRARVSAVAVASADGSSSSVRDGKRARVANVVSEAAEARLPGAHVEHQGTSALPSLTRPLSPMCVLPVDWISQEIKRFIV